MNTIPFESTNRVFKTGTLVFLLIIALLCFGVTTCHAATETVEKPSIPSGNKTADGLVYTGPGVLKDLVINTDGTNDAKLVLYDAVTATGTVVWEGTCAGKSGNGGLNTCALPLNRSFRTGLYGDQTTTGAMKWNVGYVAK